MAGRSTEPRPNGREKARAALVEDAFKRPGIREVMRVYENWQDVDHGLEPYRVIAGEQSGS